MKKLNCNDKWQQMMALTIVGCGGNNTVALQSDKAEETTKADSDATHLVLTTSALDPEVAPDYNPWLMDY